MYVSQRVNYFELAVVYLLFYLSWPIINNVLFNILIFKSKNVFPAWLNMGVHSWVFLIPFEMCFCEINF